MEEPAIRQGLRPRASLGEETHEVLLARLMSSQIPPGSRIAIDALARELGISQTPIRAALIRLETEGLVVRQHNSGFSAAPLPSAEQLRQFYEFRLLLEPETAAMATRRMTPECLAALRTHLTEMRDATKGDVAGSGPFALADMRFHDRLARQSGNALIARALDRLHQPMQMFRLRISPDLLQEALREHALILAAIEAHDPAAVAKAMTAHLAGSEKRFEPFYRLLGDGLNDFQEG